MSASARPLPSSNARMSCPANRPFIWATQKQIGSSPTPSTVVASRSGSCSTASNRTVAVL
jgi:hypothetical protein